MGRENSPHIVGPYWLDHRPDGKSPFWQAAWYDQQANTVRYRSTRCRDLKPAIDWLDAFYQTEKAKGPQSSDALVAPQIMLYWHEHGSKAVKPGQIASSLRQFLAFLFQRKQGAITFDEVKPALFREFREWRMKPHAYEIKWEGRTYKWSSKGVNGESVQRNLDDVRAALNHAENEERITRAPKVEAVPQALRSPERKRRLSIAELGSMVGYAVAGEDILLLRFILGQFFTLGRPEAVMKWHIGKQVDWDLGIIDTHPPGAPLTKKRNPVLPIPEGFRDWLRGTNGLWLPGRRGDRPTAGLRTKWRTMRRALDLDDEVIAKTIRRTVASRLRARKIHNDDYRVAMGHLLPGKASRHYIVEDPDYLADVKREIDALWIEVLFSARSWLTDHSRTKPVRGKPIMVVPRDAKC